MFVNSIVTQTLIIHVVITLSFGNSFNESELNIVGGDVAIPNEFPYIVSIRYLGSHLCGGAIINEKWVMTAAHCAQASIPFSDVTIIVGDHFLNSKDKTEESRKISRIVIHPKYNLETLFSSDICLLELNKPLKFNKFIQPVQLPPKNFQPSSGYGIVAGWGILIENSTKMPNELQKVSVPIVMTEKCKEAYAKNLVLIDETMMCAGFTGKDSCLGDSGGPLTCPGASGPVHCGIVSFGIGCARSDFPGVYAKTSYFIEFIEDVIGGKLPGVEVPQDGGGGRSIGVLNSYSMYILFIIYFSFYLI